MLLITLRSVKQYFGVVASGPDCFVQSIVGRKCIGRLPGLYLERLGKHGGDIAPCARHSGASPLRRGTPVVAGERVWVVFVLDYSFLDLLYVQRTHTNASVIKVEEAQCGNDCTGWRASRGFVRFLGCVWDWII